MVSNTDRITNLETDMAKMREEAEANRIENAMQFQEMLKAISDLSKVIGNMKSGTGEKKNDPESESSSDEDDEESVGSRKNGSEKTNKDPLRDCRKLKMPVFAGDDAHGWIYRVERYFEIQGIKGKDRLRAASICMEGAALSWYRWNEARTPCRSWEGLKKKLLDRFQASCEGNVYEQFLSIRQEGTVREFVDRFESLAGQLLDLPEKVLESTFIKGLKPELRSAIRVMEPETLARAMRMAIKMDENKNAGNVKASSGISYQPRSGGGGPTKLLYTTTTPPTTTVGDEKANSGGKGGQFTRLTEAEFAEKRAKGICFRCDEKFAPGHRCTSKTLQVLIVNDGESDKEEEEDTNHAHLDMVEVSLNSVSGLTSVSCFPP